MISRVCRQVRDHRLQMLPLGVQTCSHTSGSYNCGFCLCPMPLTLGICHCLLPWRKVHKPGVLGGSQRAGHRHVRWGFTGVPPSWPSDLCGCYGSCRILSYLCSHYRMGGGRGLTQLCQSYAFSLSLWAPYSLLLLTSAVAGSILCRSCPRL